MTTTPIVLVEDRGLLALSISTLFRRYQAELQPHGLAGPIQILGSGSSLRDWLSKQPPASVQLMVLDFSIIGGESTTILRELRSPAGGYTMPSLSPGALVIGWSAHVQEAASAFRECGADGFISKHRPVANLVEDVLSVVTRRAAGETWIEIL